MTDLDGDARTARRIALYFDGALIVGIILFMLATYVKHEIDEDTPAVWQPILALAITIAAFVFVAVRNTAALLIMAGIWAAVGLFFVVGSFTERQPRFLLPAMLFVVAAELHWSIRRKARKS